MSIADKVTAVAENVPKVFDAGKKAAYDEFWDSYQNNGSRTYYDKKFLGTVWNDNTFNPKHNIVPTSASEMFRLSNVVDLRAIMSTGKLRFTSNCSGCYGIFRECSNLEYVGDIVVSGAGNYSYLFYGCSKLKSVGTITDWNRGANNAFYNCTSLTEIRYSGSIGDKLDMSACPLNKASIESIIGCLSASATGNTLTLKKSAVNIAFETSEGAADGSTSTEWITLITPKSNQYDGTWTISLV